MTVDRWLPDAVFQAIRHHHDRAALAPVESDLLTASRRLIAVSQAAEYLLQRLRGESRAQKWQKLGEACLPLLGIDEERLRQMHDAATAITETVV